MKSLLPLLCLLVTALPVRTSTARAQSLDLLAADSLSGGTAGEPLSIEAYCEAVLAYSRTLRIAAARSEEAAETMNRQRTGFLPRLSAAGSFSLAARSVAGTERWNFALEPQLVQTLYGGGSVRAAWRQAELGYGIALCDEEFSRIEVRFAAEQAYWNLSAMALFRAAMQRYVAIIRSLKEVVDRRFAEGYIAKGDVLMIDTRLVEAEYEAVGAERNYLVALHNFNLLRGIFGDAPVALTASILDSLPMPPQRDSSAILSRRPDYAAARLRDAQAEVAVRAARAPFNPQLQVGIGGAWQPESPNRNGATRLDGTAFVQLSVPIFHWGERRRAVGAAEAQRRQQVWDTARLHDEIVREAMNSWTVLLESRAQIGASEYNLRIAGENLTLNTYSYGEGMATILDVMQAQLSWIQLYTNAIQARYSYAVAVADYARITGGGSRTE